MALHSTNDIGELAIYNGTVYGSLTPAVASHSFVHVQLPGISV